MCFILDVKKLFLQNHDPITLLLSLNPVFFCVHKENTMKIIHDVFIYVGKFISPMINLNLVLQHVENVCIVRTYKIGLEL